MSPATLFAVTAITLLIAHSVGDHWPGTHFGALHKGLRRADIDRLNATRPAGQQLHRHTGPRTCATHVATYTLTGILFLLAAATSLHLGLNPARTSAGLALNAVTHYWADRRYTLKWLCDRLSFLGKDTFYALGAPREGRDDNPSLGTGAYALDQSFHHFWIFIAALVIA